MVIGRFLWLTAVLRCVSADWQYLSRPDLAPPKLNITVSVSPQAESGYIFITPSAGFVDGSVGPEQPGAYIFRDDGELVWSGVGYLAGFVADFSPALLDNKPVLRAFQGSLDSSHGRMYGHHAVLNDRYQTINIVRAASHRLVSTHEFNLVDGKAVLIEAPVSIPADLSSYGGDEQQQWIVSNGFQELDIHTGELLFEWYSFDHVNPKHSAVPLRPDGVYSGRTALDAWNYFHINSVDKDDEGNYLISARHYSALFKINGSDGEIIWQLGGSYGSDFDIPSSLEFAFQHDARFRYRSPDGTIERISFFDNSAYTPPDKSINPFSRARFVELNHAAGTATEIRTYNAPDSLLAHSQGNFQFLPSGNKFVNWGQAGAVTEFAEDGTTLFHAYLDSYPNKNVQSYRGFRSNWTGLSSEEPAVLALRHEDGSVSVWASWNGDTETSSWHFYLLDNDAGEIVASLGAHSRTGFETQSKINLGWSLERLRQFSVVATALDSAGHELGRSRAIRIRDDTPYRAHIRERELRKDGQLSTQRHRWEL